MKKSYKGWHIVTTAKGDTWVEFHGRLVKVVDDEAAAKRYIDGQKGRGVSFV